VKARSSSKGASVLLVNSAVLQVIALAGGRWKEARTAERNGSHSPYDRIMM
jgi:hypothetical protein